MQFPQFVFLVVAVGSFFLGWGGGGGGDFFVAINNTDQEKA
jgi:hypothetical protein